MIHPSVQQLLEEQNFLLEKKNSLFTLIDFNLAQCEKSNLKISEESVRLFTHAAEKIKIGYAYLQKFDKAQTFAEPEKLNKLIEQLNSLIAHFQTIHDIALERLHLSFLTRITNAYIHYHAPKLKTLKSLYLNARGAKGRINDLDNKIFSLPNNIDELVSLEILYVRFNCLSEIPKSLCFLRNLKELGLEGNKLTSLPCEIGQLTSLKELGLDQNKIKKLPEEIGQLTTLTILSVDNNYLVDLPTSLAQLNNLVILGINNNSIFELPDLSAMNSLQVLGANNNYLTQYPHLSAQAKANHLVLGLKRNPLPRQQINKIKSKL